MKSDFPAPLMLFVMNMTIARMSARRSHGTAQEEMARETNRDGGLGELRFPHCTRKNCMFPTLMIISFTSPSFRRAPRFVEPGMGWSTDSRRNCSISPTVAFRVAVTDHREDDRPLRYRRVRTPWMVSLIRIATSSFISLAEIR